VERDVGPQLRIEVEDVVDVVETARARVGEAERRARVDEARINVRAARVDHLSAGRYADAHAGVLDDPVADDYGAALDRRPRHRNDPGIGDRDDPLGFEPGPWQRALRS
jgi:hypothetical protein